MMIAVIPGDMFPVGCAFDESIVDHITPFYTCCGLHNVLMSWGPDDYMYL
ncbi:hypothetical protein Goklo_008854, partial [Gossypium klotzschianum]|nr:hypothetical protein [Gossypium klotzschianum]